MFALIFLERLVAGLCTLAFLYLVASIVGLLMWIEERR